MSSQLPHLPIVKNCSFTNFIHLSNQFELYKSSIYNCIVLYLYTYEVLISTWPSHKEVSKYFLYLSNCIRIRGRQRKIWMDNVREDLKEKNIDLTRIGETARNREVWRSIVRASSSACWWRREKKKKNWFKHYKAFLLKMFPLQIVCLLDNSVMSSWMQAIGEPLYRREEQVKNVALIR